MFFSFYYKLYSTIDLPYNIPRIYYLKIIASTRRNMNSNDKIKNQKEAKINYTLAKKKKRN